MTGASLGVLFRKGGFTIAIGLSWGFFLVYYIMMIAGEDLADRSIVSPIMGVWGPNMILFAIALYLLLRTVREQPPLRFKLNFLKWFKKKNDKSRINNTKEK